MGLAPSTLKHLQYSDSPSQRGVKSYISEPLDDLMTPDQFWDLVGLALRNRITLEYPYYAFEWEDLGNGWIQVMDVIDGERLDRKKGTQVKRFSKWCFRPEADELKWQTFYLESTTEDSLMMNFTLKVHRNPFLLEGWGMTPKGGRTDAAQEVVQNIIQPLAPLTKYDRIYNDQSGRYEIVSDRFSVQEDWAATAESFMEVLRALNELRAGDAIVSRQADGTLLKKEVGDYDDDDYVHYIFSSHDKFLKMLYYAPTLPLQFDTLRMEVVLSVDACEGKLCLRSWENLYEARRCGNQVEKELNRLIDRVNAWYLHVQHSLLEASSEHACPSEAWPTVRNLGQIFKINA